MSHIRIIHDITPTEILEKYPNTKFVSNNVKVKVSKSCIDANCGRIPGFVVSEEQKKKISDAMMGEKNPFYGKKHSRKTKKQMSENHADFNGDKNPLVKWLNKSPNNRKIYSENISKNMKEKLKNPEYYKKWSKMASDKATKAYLNGKLNPYSNCKTGYFYSEKFNINFYFQSSYEENFLKFCENCSAIKTLTKPSFSIPYIYDNNIHQYIPDFVVNGNHIIEIKPISMMPYNNNIKKKAAAEKYCEEFGYHYYIVTEKELNNLDEEVKTWS
jgi:hypothetical protein